MPNVEESPGVSNRQPAPETGGNGSGGEAGNGSAALNGEARDILQALTALRRGDHQHRLPMEWTGMAGRIADAFNDVADLNTRLNAELARLSRVVGKEGKLR